MISGEVNLNWIKFKRDYLFSVNVGIVLSIILFVSRKDFLWHPVILIWVSICFLSPKARKIQERAFHILGKINSTIILTIFYFLFFTPFGLIYRLFFRHDSFKKNESTFMSKTSISDFNRPF